MKRATYDAQSIRVFLIVSTIFHVIEILHTEDPFVAAELIRGPAISVFS
jgi:hypothetical protein